MGITLKKKSIIIKQASDCARMREQEFHKLTREVSQWRLERPGMLIGRGFGVGFEPNPSTREGREWGFERM